jgi:hypothetical protein
MDCNLEDTFPVMGTNSQNERLKYTRKAALYALKIGKRMHLCRWQA